MYPSGWRSLIGIPAIGWSDPGLPPPLLAGSPPWRSRSSWPPSLPPELVCATAPSSSPCSSPDGGGPKSVSYTHLRAHETKANLVCRLLLEKKKKEKQYEEKKY